MNDWQVIKAPPPPLPAVYSEEVTALARWMLQKDPLRRPTLTQVARFALGSSFEAPVVANARADCRPLGMDAVPVRGVWGD